MNVLLQGIKAGNGTRGGAARPGSTTTTQAGVTKQIKFDETGEVVGGTVYAYKVEDGNLEQRVHRSSDETG